MTATRKTGERAQILKILAKVHVPLTVEEIKKKVGRTVHTATIYRALNDLVSSGVIRRVDIHARSARYESNADHHHHIVCTECGLIEDVHTEPKGLDAKVLSNSKRFKSIVSHSLEFFGVCKSCASKKD
jgi:Fe2+ or Zn2+ uptake regulation protein